MLDMQNNYVGTGIDFSKISIILLTYTIKQTQKQKGGSSRTLSEASDSKVWSAKGATVHQSLGPGTPWAHGAGEEETCFVEGTVRV